MTIANLINKEGDYKSEILILNKGIGVEYSGENKKLLSEIGDFQFTAYDVAIADLYKYYTKIKDSLDVSAIKKDAYLEYAKKLHNKYFSKQNEK